jgi:hypothetical protein
MIAVGCQVLSHKDWLRHYVRIGECNGYTPQEIEEYGRILHFVIDNAVPIGVVEAKDEAEMRKP